MSIVLGPSMHFHLISVAVLLRILSHAHSVSAAQSKYSLIIDSGSSGTRIYAYRWQPSLQPDVEMPIVQVVKPSAASSKIPRRVKADTVSHLCLLGLTAGMYERVETQPGLSAFVDDSKGLKSIALQPLLDWAKAVVPRRQWKCTPIFLLATAGVRKLDTERKSRLMSDVQAILAVSGFRFKPQWARIITGAEEGAFGWVAANYQAGLLNAKPLPAASPITASDQAGSSSTKNFDSSHLVQGTLDLGGSSLEITFLEGASIVTDSKTDRQSSDLDTPHDTSMAVNGSSTSQVTVLVVGPMKFELKTQTFKHFGLSDTFDRSVTVLLQDALVALPDMLQSITATNASSIVNESGVTKQVVSSKAEEGMAQTKSSAGTANPVAGLLGKDGRLTFEQPSIDQVIQAPIQQSEDAITREALQQAKDAEMKSLLVTAQIISSQSSPGTSSSVAVTSALQMQARKLADAVPPPNLQLESDGQGHTKVTAGQTLARKVDMLILSNGTILEHPCLHTGYKAPYSRMHHFGKFTDTMEVLLVGTSDVPACQRLVKRLVTDDLLICQSSLDSSATTGMGPAIPESALESASSVIQRPVISSVGSAASDVMAVGKADCGSPAAGLTQLGSGLHGLITALTGFFVVWRFFLGGTVTASKPADAETLLPAVHEMCNKPWSHINAELGHHINVEKYCLWGHYAVDLLSHEGLDLLSPPSLGNKPAVSIGIVEDMPCILLPAGPGDIGWSLGAALSEVSRAAPDVFSAKTSNSAGGWFKALSRQSCEEGTSITVASAVAHTARHRLSFLLPLTVLSSIVLLVVYLGWRMFRKHQQRHHQTYRVSKPPRLGSTPPLLPVSTAGTVRGTRRTPSYLNLGRVTSGD